MRIYLRPSCTVRIYLRPSCTVWIYLMPSWMVRIYIRPSCTVQYLLGAKLHSADLSEAELYGADLRWTELHGANLSETRLHGANLWPAILKNTDLSYVHWDKPEDWDNIIINIHNSLKKRGSADDMINNWALSEIAGISLIISSTEFGFFPPNRPSENDCVFHSGQGPFDGVAGTERRMRFKIYPSSG